MPLDGAGKLGITKEGKKLVKASVLIDQHPYLFLPTFTIRFSHRFHLLKTK